MVLRPDVSESGVWADPKPRRSVGASLTPTVNRRDTTHPLPRTLIPLNPERTTLRPSLQKRPLPLVVLRLEVSTPVVPRTAFVQCTGRSHQDWDKGLEACVTLEGLSGALELVWCFWSEVYPFDSEFV